MSEITNAIKTICDEKGLSYDAVIVTIESALAAAYRKDFGQKNQNIKVRFDPETAQTKVYDEKTVVEDMPEEIDEEAGEKVEKKDEGVSEKKAEKKEKPDDKEKDDKEKVEAEDEEEIRKFNPKTELQLSDAKSFKKTAKIGDVITTKLEVPGEFGRMAAQTAKQVIIQRLREAERDMILDEFKDKEREVVSGVVQRREGRVVLIDLGKAVGVLPNDEQIYGEKYNPGERIKIFIKQVSSTAKGPEIVLSRTSEEILKKVFYLEIPEISNGLIELKSVAREAGSRSKVAVSTESESVDPIGSCVGQRGSRIQTIITELGGEKVDIIEYDEEPTRFIKNSLSPAKIINIELNEEQKTAAVKVLEDQLSLAIGKGGQNARLAAKLTGWKIDILVQEEDKKGEDKEKEEKSTDSSKTEKKDSKEAKKEKGDKADEKENNDEDKKDKNEKEK